MKMIRLLFLILVALWGVSSCRNEDFKSLSELKKDQKTNIENLIKQNSWKVEELKEKTLPKNYNKDTYYKFPNGLYMKVIDEGTGKMAEKDKTVISLYADGYMSHKDNMKYSEFKSLSEGGYIPVDFIYTEYYSQGDIHYQTINNPTPNGVNISQIMCEGLAYPMTMLGDKARVSLIIPFELCPSYAYQNGASMVITEVKYEFKKQSGNESN